jgi:hypothetical protein
MISWKGHAAHMKMRNAYKTLVNLGGKDNLAKRKNIKKKKKALSILSHVSHQT